MPAEARVDVSSDNTTRIAVSLPTTAPQQRKGTRTAWTQRHRNGRRIVRDNIDNLDHCPDDRVMQKTNWQPICQRQDLGTEPGRCDDRCPRRMSATSTTILVIAGIATSAVGSGLNDATALSSPNGITVNVFDNLAGLPHYSETLENQPLPRPVAALRDAAVEADAAMVVTNYYGHIPATVHNAIDWLTRRWNHSALHRKPLAVIGPMEDGYSGVWSRHHTEESRRTGGTRVIEPVTVATLFEAVTRLAEQANITKLPSSPHSLINRACGRAQLH